MAEMNEQVQGTERVTVRGISMYPSDWMEVDVLAKVSGVSASAAVRRIIREWRQLREPKPAGNGDRLDRS